MLAWIERNMASPVGGFHEAVPVRRSRAGKIRTSICWKPCSRCSRRRAMQHCSRPRTRWSSCFAGGSSPNDGSLGEFFTYDWRWFAPARRHPCRARSSLRMGLAAERVSTALGRPVEPERSALMRLPIGGAATRKAGACAISSTVGRGSRRRLARSAADRGDQGASGHGRTGQTGEQPRSRASSSNLLERFVAGNRAGTWNSISRRTERKRTIHPATRSITSSAFSALISLRNVPALSPSAHCSYAPRAGTRVILAPNAFNRSSIRS